ncbi:hypothetical protein BT69DRAFT_204631 [Atractiella rhizophila]|nr:hypothetical protein BT69DRAFT_204631 [Atractiella rhizophila]
MSWYCCSQPKLSQYRSYGNKIRRNNHTSSSARITSYPGPLFGTHRIFSCVLCVILATASFIRSYIASVST